MAISNSINRSLTGLEALCMMKTSSPRTDSWIVMDVSPLEKRFASRLFTGYPSLCKSNHQNRFSFQTV